MSTTAPSQLHALDSRRMVGNSSDLQTQLVCFVLFFKFLSSVVMMLLANARPKLVSSLVNFWAHDKIMI